jgi:hypothetical protein
MFDIETPEQSSKIQEDTAFRDMQAGANSSSSTETEMVSFLNVRMGRIFAGRELMMQIPFWFVLPPLVRGQKVITFSGSG